MPPKIVVPWRPDGEDRVTVWAFLKGYWEALGWPIVEVDSGDEPFNRGRSQNLGGLGEWDVMLVLDADVVVPLEAVRAGVTLSETTGAIVLPHDRYVALTDRETQGFMLSGALPDSPRTARHAAGGLHIIPRSVWQALQYDGETAPRGQDRRFTSDARQLGIDVIRLPGPIIHLHHERPDKAESKMALWRLIQEVDPGALENSGRWVKAYRRLVKEGRWAI